MAAPRLPPGPGRVSRVSRVSRGSSSALVACIAVAVAALTGLAYWDEHREFEAALADFADEQTLVATALAADVSARLAVARRDALRLAAAPPGEALRAARADGYAGLVVREGAAAPAVADGAFDLPVTTPDGRVVDLLVPTAKLLEGLRGLERPGAARALLVAPDGAALRTTDGRAVDSAPLAAALASSATSTWLDRGEAERLGLARRRAAAGIARVDAGALGLWSVVLVTSAERERDREQRAEIRLVLSCVFPVALVLAFGAVALRKQRKELLLARELAISHLSRSRDAVLEKATRAATLGTLAMGIAHEVSTPLGVIVGRAEQLGGRQTDERGARAVSAIAEEADRIRRVVRGFLDLARGEAPTLGLADPASILSAALGLVDHRFTGAGVALTVEIEPDLPGVHCDRAMLGQAVVNLLLNACDASPAGSTVTARLHAEDGRVTFDVRDQGAGIPPEVAARVTEPFFTTKPAGQGTGLGLAITSEIVKLHHGELVLRPASPRGTSAAIIIPVRGELRDAA